MLIRYMMGLQRGHKAILVGLADSLLVIFSLWLAFSLRLGELYQPAGNQWLLFVVAPMIALPIFVRLGLYRAVIRYIGQRAMLTIGYANAGAALLWSLVPFYLPNFIDLSLFSPRSLPFIYWMVLCITIGGSRQSVRWFVAGILQRGSDKNVLIYGAGEAGVQLALSLEHSQEMVLLGFIDDDPGLKGQQIAGLPVVGGIESIEAVKARHDTLEVLLALPSATRSDRQAILKRLELVEVAVRTMPSLDDIALGRAKLTELDEIDTLDLLGRDFVEPQHDLMSRCISGKTVLVTGAGGSIGSELCRQIVQHKPERLILLDHGEYPLYSIEADLRLRCASLNTDVELIPLLGSVNDEGLLKRLFSQWEINTVYHAAAYKHVPIVEHNLIVGVNNNVLGTYHLATQAMQAGVARFVLISTDKAVRPTNSMGASKRLAEMVLQGLQLAPENRRTCFSMVRFGNVLGSSGSVIPLFQTQIAAGGPVTVTHPEITRYFMTIPEAASLVIQAGALGEGGELFVLDMGDPVKIDELARRMVRLSGHRPGVDGIDVVYTGLRHGEKLYEELLIGDNVSGTTHPRILVAREEGPDYAQLNTLIAELINALTSLDAQRVRECLLRNVTGFEAQCGNEDLLWRADKMSRDK